MNFYNYDWIDEKESVLEELGITSTIPYKAERVYL
jgi:hypothetical protein